MNQYRDNTIHAHFGYGQINTKGYLDHVYEKPWEHWIDNWKELKEYLMSLPGVYFVFPRISFSALLTHGSVTVSGDGHGIDGVEEAKFFHAINIEAGDMLTTQPKGILLGKGLADALNVKPGDLVTVRDNSFHGNLKSLELIVTGVFHTGSKAFDDHTFCIPLAQTQLLLDSDRIESVALGLHSIDDWQPVATAVEKHFPGLEATSFAVLDKVYYQHSVDWLKAQFWVIQVIILTIVILGIFNTTSTSILERKQEMGNLRANGESSWDLLKLLCLEGVTLGAIGAFIGIGLAWFINNTFLYGGILMPPAPGLTRQFHVMIELQPEMACITFGLGLLTALVATFAASLRVARMPIGELLRAV